MISTYEHLGGTYWQEGNYLLPNLEMPESPLIGIWGELRRRYLREHEKATYTVMLLIGTLNAHLEEVDRSASKMFDRLVSQMESHEGISEKPKATDQIEWVRQMNNIRNRADEITSNTLISK